jgi:hypothetical protein
MLFTHFDKLSDILYCCNCTYINTHFLLHVSLVNEHLQAVLFPVYYFQVSYKLSFPDDDHSLVGANVHLYLPRHLEITQYRQEPEANNIFPVLLGHLQGTKATGENYGEN